MICSSCGADNRDEARFCDSCGGALSAHAPAREQRKIVTVLFCDVTGSTALAERLDPEALRNVMGRYFDVARVAIERHGGTLEKFIGDAVMAVFGVPVVREDDALRAVRAALELRDAVEIDVRIGVNTGEVVTGSGDSLVTGDAVNVAARLEQAAVSGEVLIGSETYALVRDAVEVELLPPVEAKGKSAPLTAYRLTRVTGDPGIARRLDADLVGRKRERQLLAGAWERTCSERASTLFTVLGAAGVGKSRLAAEFLSGIDATVVRGSCLSYGEGITYSPVVEVVKQLLGGSEASTPGLAALLGDGRASAEEIAFAVRKLFEAAAAERPLVVLFDDLQWAEPTFLDLIEHVVDWSRGAPIFLLCLARADLLERRPGWAGGKLNATTVLLESLSPEETDELITRLHPGRAIDPSLRERIRTAADGNPLFVEQMLAMVEASPGETAVPATIQALLASRLDQLPPAERAALERGAIEGQVFHRSAVAALAPDDPGIGAHLFGLVRKELVRPTTGMLAGDDAFRFKHLLIRDAAYDALPKATRADLHERFASWLQARAPDLVELDEVLGYHLEQAATCRHDLGLPAPDLAAAGARRLAAAGRRAVDRGDIGAGEHLLKRALNLMTDDARERGEVLCDLGRALHARGELDGADATLSRAIESDDRDAAACAFFYRAVLRAGLRGHAGGLVALQTEVQSRLAELETALVHDRTLAQGYVALANFRFWNGACDAAVEAGKRAEELARSAGDARLETEAIGMTGVSMFHGAAPWPLLEEHAAAVLAQVDRLGSEALNARAGLAGAAAYGGRFDEARALYAEHHAALEERGRTFALVASAQMHGLCELLAEDFEQAEQILREGWDSLGRMGERGFRSTLGGHLGEALVELGRVDEAVAILDEAEALGDDDWLTSSHCLYVRGLAASRRGEHDRAIGLAREATEIADARDYVSTRTNHWLGLGRVLLAAGRREDARTALEESLRLALWKVGSVVYERRARRLLAELDALDSEARAVATDRR
jgi:class 3 adenylate cyclase/tetratricopeptide (TPR) repeat protein